MAEPKDILVLVNTPGFEPDYEVTTLSEEQVAMMLDFFSEMDFNKM